MKYIFLNLVTENRIIKIFLSYHRYLSLKNLIVKNNFIVILTYNYKNFNYDLFIEDFFLFRLKYLKYIDIILKINFLSDFFLKNLVYVLFEKFVPGNTLIRFKFFYMGKYRFICFNKNLKFAIHDNFLDFLYMLKEVDFIDLNYDF